MLKSHNHSPVAEPGLNPSSGLGVDCCGGLVSRIISPFKCVAMRLRLSDLHLKECGWPQLLCSETFHHTCSAATLPMVCIPLGPERVRNTKAGLLLGGTEIGDSCDGSFHSRTPWWTFQTRLELHCGLRHLHKPFFPPSLLPFNFPASSFSCPIFCHRYGPNKYLARIIPSHCLLLRGPGLTH